MDLTQYTRRIQTLAAQGAQDRLDRWTALQDRFDLLTERLKALDASGLLPMKASVRTQTQVQEGDLQIHERIWEDLERLKARANNGHNDWLADLQKLVQTKESLSALLEDKDSALAQELEGLLGENGLLREQAAAAESELMALRKEAWEAFQSETAQARNHLTTLQSAWNILKNARQENQGSTAQTRRRVLYQTQEFLKQLSQFHEERTQSRRSLLAAAEQDVRTLEATVLSLEEGRQAKIASAREEWASLQAARERHREELKAESEALKDRLKAWKEDLEAKTKVLEEDLAQAQSTFETESRASDEEIRNLVREQEDLVLSAKNGWEEQEKESVRAQEEWRERLREREDEKRRKELDFQNTQAALQEQIHQLREKIGAENRRIEQSRDLRQKEILSWQAPLLAKLLKLRRGQSTQKESWKKTLVEKNDEIRTLKLRLAMRRERVEAEKARQKSKFDAMAERLSRQWESAHGKDLQEQKGREADLAPKRRRLEQLLQELSLKTQLFEDELHLTGEVHQKRKALEQDVAHLESALPHQVSKLESLLSKKEQEILFLHEEVKEKEMTLDVVERHARALISEAWSSVNRFLKEFVSSPTDQPPQPEKGAAAEKTDAR